MESIQHAVMFWRIVLDRQTGAVQIFHNGRVYSGICTNKTRTKEDNLRRAACFVKDMVKEILQDYQEEQLSSMLGGAEGLHCLLQAAGATLLEIAAALSTCLD